MNNPSSGPIVAKTFEDISKIGSVLDVVRTAVKEGVVLTNADQAPAPKATPEATAPVDVVRKPAAHRR